MSIKKLENFTSKDEYVSKNRPELTKVAETEKYYISSDGFRAGVLFKNDSRELDNKFDNAFELIQRTIKDIKDNAEYSITINRKELVKNLTELWKVFKEEYKVLTEYTIHKDETMIVFDLDSENHEIAYGLQPNRSTRMQTGANCIQTNILYSKLHEELTIAVNFKYFEEYLDFFTSNNQIEIKYTEHIQKPIITETDDRLAILMQCRLK
jgi:hypothetical protein